MPACVPAPRPATTLPHPVGVPGPSAGRPSGVTDGKGVAGGVAERDTSRDVPVEHRTVEAARRIRVVRGGLPVTSPRVRRQVRVLGRLSLSPEDRLSAAARRALAYLAVKGPVVQRSLMGMDLWPLGSDARARANLRRALWQVPRGWVSATSWEVRLEPDVEVDLVEARTVADLALDDGTLDVRQVDLLTRDLLPGWYEDWLADEQDEQHLVRVQGLEAVCRTATGLRQFGLATRAGLAAVAAEPLRQSAVVALVRAHLEEGNAYEALRRVEAYGELLRVELGVDPPDEVCALVAGVSSVGAGTGAGGRARPGALTRSGSRPSFRR